MLGNAKHFRRPPQEARASEQSPAPAPVFRISKLELLKNYLKRHIIHENYVFRDLQSYLDAITPYLRQTIEEGLARYGALKVTFTTWARFHESDNENEVKNIPLYIRKESAIVVLNLNDFEEFLSKLIGKMQNNLEQVIKTIASGC
jgi:hypothetical protein